jgi:hypothetical protein
MVRLGLRWNIDGRARGPRMCFASQLGEGKSMAISGSC